MASYYFQTRKAIEILKKEYPPIDFSETIEFSLIRYLILPLSVLRDVEKEVDEYQDYNGCDGPLYYAWADANENFKSFKRWTHFYVCLQTLIGVGIVLYQI